MVELEAERRDERRVVEQRLAGVPMKFVATPRPEKNDWKSIVGPWMVALRPPAHSTWATLRPPRSADWAIDSAWSTFGSKAAVRLRERLAVDVEGVVRRAVDARPGAGRELYQPAPVFGGAWVSRPLPVAEMPFLRKRAIVGSRPCAAYFATRSWRRPSAAKKTALSVGGFALALALAVEPACDVPAADAVRINTTIALKRTMERNRMCDATSDTPSESKLNVGLDMNSAAAGSPGRTRIAHANPDPPPGTARRAATRLDSGARHDGRRELSPAGLADRPRAARGAAAASRARA